METIAISYTDLVNKTSYAKKCQMSKRECLRTKDSFYSDPDYIKTKMHEKIPFFDVHVDGIRYVCFETKLLVKKYGSMVTLFHSEVLRESFTKLPSPWDNFNNSSRAIAYRGGRGYSYSIWEIN